MRGHARLARGMHGGSWPGPLFNDLDSLPTPRYDEYFGALAASPLGSPRAAGPSAGILARLLVGRGPPVHVLRAERNQPGLPVQVTRAGARRGTRARGPVRRQRLRGGRQHPRHGYHKTLLPALAADTSTRRIFYEIKANVSRAQVAALVDAGIMWVQPGIESLHSEVLALMDKGIQGWQNVQLLKWARELGLRLSWSILWGFPGEKDDWYEDMAEWLPALAHLHGPPRRPRRASGTTGTAFTTSRPASRA